VNAFAPNGESLLAECTLAALDVETTGLSAGRGDRIIEIALVIGRRGEEPRTWSSLVNPERPVGATHIHGITEDMLVGQPRFSELVPTLAELLTGTVVVAHNASFDMGFLAHECTGAGLRLPQQPVLDTLGMARRVLGFGDHRLSSLCTRFNLRRERAHRALDDALATWHLLWRLADTADGAGGLRLASAQVLSRRRTDAEVDGVISLLERARAGGKRVVVDYLSGITPEDPPIRRTLTIQRVSRSRVKAWCHLRDAERTFRLDRLRIVDDGVS
jgi:DNA polymerase III epsilon subunit family exonuclease